MTSRGTPPGVPGSFDVHSVDSGEWWCRVTLSGELDMATGPQFRAVVDAALSRDRRHIAVDASGLTFIDSSGLVALLSAREQAMALEGSLRLTAASPAVLRVLDMAGVADELLDQRH